MREHAGSAGLTLKPFVLSALLKRGKLRPDSMFRCRGRLAIGNRRFDCTHTPIVTPIRADTALAYSCNCFVAHAAEQFGPSELAGELISAGFTYGTSLAGSGEFTGRLQSETTPDGQCVRALGETAVLTTQAEIALAYRQLAINVDRPENATISDGLEGGMEFGTAQQGLRESKWGKTGSTRTSTGDFIA